MEELPKLPEIENSLVLFCMATYGEGDPTDNAQEFYDWLKDTDEDLSGLKYAVFGLGNKTYEHFNAIGRFVDAQLEKLGAERVFERGEGDDDANIEEDFVTWKTNLWLAVCEKFGLEASGEDESLRDFRLEVYENLDRSKVFTGEMGRLKSYNHQKPPYDAKNPYMAPLLVNTELHKSGDRSCMHIELDISGTNIRYSAGDHVAIYPTNNAAIVQKLADLLQFDLDQVFSLISVDEQATKKNPFPCPCSFRTALLHYVDITSPPRTHVLKEIARYASDKNEIDTLLQMGSGSEEGKSEYNEWVIKDHRSIVEVLESMPSVRPPIDHVLELLPRLQARYFSISSSPKMYPETIHVTAALVDYKTRIGRRVEGVATSWLATKRPNDHSPPKVPIFVRKSNFRPPIRAINPVIMIGPGTGLAPFRGFIQDRSVLVKKGQKIGDTLLFFGCRRKSEDYLYEEELNSYLEEGTLKDLQVAFSRDQDHKIYVTHLLQNCKETVWKLVSDGGHICVSGDAKSMARDVHNALVKICQNCGKMTEAEAETYIKTLSTKGRYSVDVWS
ncbi:NADPH--cytochrome P450 reductase-like isoform X2 [Corticium candelabrum]|nr:NADPH--cytochrome P450 reductase-like isoform X2 [Corticium candelabrum]